MNKKAIYLVGNSIVPKDAMPFKIKPFLQKTFPDIEDPHAIFIDTAINLTVPRLFKNINEFEPFLTRGLSVHNFDFHTELALREKLVRDGRYTIIAVPPDGDLKKITPNVAKLLASVVS